MSELNVLLSKIDSCLAGLSRNTCCDDDNVSILNLIVVTAVDVHLTEERKTVADIKCFTESLVLINVDKDELGAKLLHGNSECDCCTYGTCTDDTNLGTF